MIYFVAGKGMRTPLLLCVTGSATAVTALLVNHPATLLIYLFLGQPLLIVGMVLIWKSDWKEILKNHVSGDRRDFPKDEKP